MGNYNDILLYSGFDSMPESKYYNKYTSNNINTACNGSECVSHGLSETAGWYYDSNSMIDDTSSWLIRGGSYTGDVRSGNNYFAYNDGWNHYNCTFRFVMSPGI